MIEKFYLPDEDAFKSLSRDWPLQTPKPPAYPCIIVWTWYHGVSDWVQVVYIFPDDFINIT